MNEVGMGCKLALSPLMTMIKQLPDELEDVREEVEIMHKWLETGEGSRGEIEIPELYKEPYLNEIENLAIREGGLWLRACSSNRRWQRGGCSTGGLLRGKALRVGQIHLRAHLLPDRCTQVRSTRL
jgi:hypothetical protein